VTRFLSKFSDAEAAHLIPAPIACENRIVAITAVAGTLVVGASEPLSEELQEKLQFILNRRVRGVIRSEEWITEKLQELYDVPDDVSDRNEQPAPVHWYWISCRREDEEPIGDRTFYLKTSGWDIDEDGRRFHYSGAAEISKDHPDHEMWKWVMEYPYFEGLIDERDVPRIRRIWNRYRQRTGKSLG
jgi:hypothetical protein